MVAIYLRLNSPFSKSSLWFPAIMSIYEIVEDLYFLSICVLYINEELGIGCILRVHKIHVVPTSVIVHACNPSRGRDQKNSYLRPDKAKYL
jgi:hypothetical protein